MVDYYNKPTSPVWLPCMMVAASLVPVVLAGFLVYECSVAGYNCAVAVGRGASAINDYRKSRRDAKHTVEVLEVKLDKAVTHEVAAVTINKDNKGIEGGAIEVVQMLGLIPQYATGS